MPKLKDDKLPSYRLHRQSQQAIVTLNGRDVLLGPYNSPASREKYNRVTSAWLANGRQLRVEDDNPQPATVVEIVAAFKRHAQTYYRGHDGAPTSELNTFKQAWDVLVSLYGRTPAEDFKPLCLKAVREAMIEKGWCRTYINKQVNRLKLIFGWAVENELIPPHEYHSLLAVKGLKAGRSSAPESEPVRAVAEEHVQATLPHLSKVVAAMVELQLLTGMRPAETCILRGCDLETTGKVWLYRPAHHKTEHHGHERTVYLGPQAQAIVKEFLKLDPQAYLFDPREADAEIRQERREERVTPVSCGNIAGSNKRRAPKRKPGSNYDVPSYRRAIARACDRAFPPPDHLRPVVEIVNGKERRESRRVFLARLTAEQRAELVAWHGEHRWHPNQLRHSAGTRLRKEYGLDVAQVILGHKTLTMTQVYSEVNTEKAQRVMAQVG